MEFFSGSAGLSFEARRAGFNVIAVDHDRNRHRLKVAQVSLDLTSNDSQGIALEMLKQVRPLAVHLGLPCGTCSRARERLCRNIFSETTMTPNHYAMLNTCWVFPSLVVQTKRKSSRPTCCMSLESKFCSFAFSWEFLWQLKTRRALGFGEF